MRADNSDHLKAAARRRSEETLARTHARLDVLTEQRRSVTVAQLAQMAGVSRSWIYTQPLVLERLDQLALMGERHPEVRPVDLTRATTASLQHRLELAYDRLRELQEENRQLRDELARAYGERRSQLQRSGPASPSGGMRSAGAE